MMKAINPATEKLIQEYPEHSSEQVQQMLKQAGECFQSWRRTTFETRSDLMKATAEVLRRNRDQLARLMTTEMGKPIKESEGEIDKCAWVCDFYAERAADFLADRLTDTDAKWSYVRYQPLGAVLAVMPWNFPFWQVFRFAAPALMAGNVGLLKHASNVPGCAVAIERVFQDAGFPAGAFTTLLIDREASEEVIQSNLVRAVTLTGSERAGRSVAATAGGQIKKTVLELGGSDPFIVLPDAPLAKAAAQAAKARTINSGQSCIAAKRFIIDRAVLGDFEQLLVQEMETLRMDDPLNRETDVGPQARQDLMQDLDDQVQRSREAGAQVLCGGEPSSGVGYYYPPTVLSQVEPGMAAFDEETFGPVAAVIAADDADHAVQLANRSSLGLGASIWTADARRGEEMARGIEAGAVFVNEIVKSDPRLPFGGVKNSGYGRELAEEGIREFMNIKTVWVND